jgi:hypothetical protein
MRSRDRRWYPLTSTCAYLATPLVVDVWTAAHRLLSTQDCTFVWSAGNALVCLPWGPTAVLALAALGLAVGTGVALGARVVLRGHFDEVSRRLASGRGTTELLLLAAWLLGVVVAYRVGNVAAFHGLGGVVAGANVLAARVLIYSDLTALCAAAAEERAQVAVHPSPESRAA